eukprot:jgi/Tetstr1/436332/TSEL_025170.t1
MTTKRKHACLAPSGSSQATVTLLVGDTRYRAARDTLTVSPTLRMLLDSGRADEDGAYFVDRNGAVFEHILHFLRYGLLMPGCQKDMELRRQVAHDAEYFQLSRLVCMCHVGYKPAVLPAKDVEALEEWRAVVRLLNMPPAKGEDPLVGLLDVYNPAEPLPEAQPRSMRDAACAVLGLEEAEQAVPWENVEGKLAVPGSPEEFKVFLDKTTGGILDDLPELVRKSCVVAGGCVCAALCSTEAQTDVDFFLHGLEDEEVAATVVKELAEYMRRKSDNQDVVVVRTHMAITIVAGPPLPHVQVVLQLFRSPAAVLASFDMAPSQCLYHPLNGKVYATKWALRALQTRVNVMDPCCRRLLSDDGHSMYEKRLLKYAARGFRHLPAWPRAGSIGPCQHALHLWRLPGRGHGQEALRDNIDEYPGYSLYTTKQQLMDTIHAHVMAGIKGGVRSVAEAERLAFRKCPIDVFMPEMPRTGRLSYPLLIHATLTKAFETVVAGFPKWQKLRRQEVLEHRAATKRCPVLGFCWDYYNGRPVAMGTRRNNWYQRWDDEGLSSAVHFVPSNRISFVRPADVFGAQQHGARAADKYIREAYTPDLRRAMLCL